MRLLRRYFKPDSSFIARWRDFMNVLVALDFFATPLCEVNVTRMAAKMRVYDLAEMPESRMRDAFIQTVAVFDLFWLLHILVILVRTRLSFCTRMLGAHSC